MASPIHAQFGTTKSLETHHYHLLHSQEPLQQILGYLSVVYWGFFSGQNHVENPRRAMGKVQLARDGHEPPEWQMGILEMGLDAAAMCIDQANANLRDDKLLAALNSVLPLPGAGVAFASKVCTFMSPTKCGILDSVIAIRYPDLSFGLRDGVVTNTIRNRNSYVTYCEALQGIARDLNAHGVAARWADDDGRVFPWRAVDVERALY
jgi:hypothetical protein